MDFFPSLGRQFYGCKCGVQQEGRQSQRQILRGIRTWQEGEEEEGQVDLRHRGGIHAHQEDEGEPIW